MKEENFGDRSLPETDPTTELKHRELTEKIIGVVFEYMKERKSAFIRGNPR